MWMILLYIWLGGMPVWVLFEILFNYDYAYKSWPARIFWAVTWPIWFLYLILSIIFMVLGRL